MEKTIFEVKKTKLSKKEIWKRNQFYIKTKFELSYPSMEYIWDGKKWKRNLNLMMIREQQRIEDELSVPKEELRKMLEISSSRKRSHTCITEEVKL